MTPSAGRPDNAHAVMLYDGVCNLCNGSVAFVLKRDRSHLFRFASLQSDVAHHMLDHFGIVAQLDTIYLIEGNRVYDRSSAALRMLQRLGFPWAGMALFLLVPKPLRDAGYNFIGRRRYRWFGHADHCQRPTPDVRKYFLDQGDD